jgi:hypothetical protein
MRRERTHATLAGLAAVAVTILPVLAGLGEPAHARYFGGYPCTKDCKTHAAGFKWAREHRVTNPDNCSGESRSFIQGCRAYGSDRMRDFSKDDDGAPIEGQ